MLRTELPINVSSSFDIQLVDDLGDLLQLLLSECDIRSGEVLLDAFGPARSWEGNHMRAERRDPCEGQLRGADAFLLRDSLQVGLSCQRMIAC